MYATAGTSCATCAVPFKWSLKLIGSDKAGLGRLLTIARVVGVSEKMGNAQGSLVLSQSCTVPVYECPRCFVYV